MSDIFGDLSGEQAPTAERENLPGLETIFSSEFLARFGADEVSLAARGVIKALRGVYHPDTIISNADAAVAEEINSGTPESELSESAKRLKQAQLNGASVVDELTKLGDRVTANPAEAKLSALEKIRRRGERITSPARKTTVVSPKVRAQVSGKFAKAFEQDQLTGEEVLERKRQIFQMLQSDYALHRYPLVAIGEDVEGKLVLATITNLDDAHGKKDFGVITRQLRSLSFLEDRAQIVEAEEYLVNNDIAAADEIIRSKEMAEINEEFNIPVTSPEHQDLTFNVNGESKSLGMQNITNFIARINRSGDVRTQDGSDAVADYYELAILKYDRNQKPYYELLPTTLGLAEGCGPTNDSDGAVTDWALNAYAEMPDVIRFRNVPSIDRDEPTILRVWAYAAEAPQRTISLDSGGGSVHDTFVQALGFVPNANWFEQVASDEPMAGALEAGSSYQEKTRLKMLDPETDVAVLSGKVMSFLPHLMEPQAEPGKGVSETVIRPDLLIRLQVGGGYGNVPVQINDIDETQMYALKNIRVLGVNSSLHSDRAGLMILRQAEQGLQEVKDALAGATSRLGGARQANLRLDD